MWRIMHIMIYVDKWNLSVVGLNLQKKNPLTSICFPINYAKHVHSCTFLVGIYSAIYTGRVARQYGICWLKKELSMVHGTLHIFFRNKTFLSVKIGSWHFQHLFDLGFRKKLAKFQFIPTNIQATFFYGEQKLSEWAETLLGFTK